MDWNVPDSLAASLENDYSVAFALDPELRIQYCNRSWDEFAAANGARHLTRAWIRGREILPFISGNLADYYGALYSSVLRTRTPRRHDYSCSSEDLLRRFAMHVYPAGEWPGLIVVNSLLVERSHDEPARAAVASAYQFPDGCIVMCGNCRRSQRPGEAAAWDWVPGFVSAPPLNVSHGLCPPCGELYHLSFENYPA
jgi:hypothetical protein